MTFTDPLATEFRTLFERALTGLHQAGHDVICHAVAGAGGFDLEVPVGAGGLELGLSPSAELFLVLGTELVDVSAVEATTAAVDLLLAAGGAEHAPAITAMRSGDAICLAGAGGPGHEGTHRVKAWFLHPASHPRWALDGYEGSGGNTFLPPPGWPERRLLRHAAYLTGLADAAYRAAADHCRKREVGGEPLRAGQVVSDRLVRQLLAVRLAWAATQAAVCAFDRGDTGPVAARRAHDLARDAAWTVSRGLLQLLGARGLTERSAGPLVYRTVQREAHRFDPARRAGPADPL
jgi:hypothetical protein